MSDPTLVSPENQVVVVLDKDDNHTRMEDRTQTLIATLRDVCPPEKHGDLQLLVETLGGDEDLIRQRIQEWWEEPLEGDDEADPSHRVSGSLEGGGGAGPSPDEWADVHKKNTKKVRQQQQTGGGGGGGRGEGRGRGRGGRGRGGGRRGGDGGGGGGGRSGRSSHHHHHNKAQQHNAGGDHHHGQSGGAHHDFTNDHHHPPVGTVHVGHHEAEHMAPALKRVAEGGPPAEVSFTVTVDQAGTITSSEPVAAIPPPPPVAPPKPPARPAGNVWATKGSAHLIQAEKPKPPPAPIARSTPAPRTLAPTPPATSTTHNMSSSMPGPSSAALLAPGSKPALAESSPLIPQHASMATSSAPTGVVDLVTLEASMGTATTNKLAGSLSSTPQLESGMEAWVTESTPSSLDRPTPPSSSASTAVVGSKALNVGSAATTSRQAFEKPRAPASTVMPPVTALPPAPKPASRPPPVPTNLLNMGHWGTAVTDDANIDFGFGSFGTDNDTAGSLDATTASNSTNHALNPTGASTANTSAASAQDLASTTTSVSTTSPSPARPPPGLSIGGMPPMPTNAVLVHELENKLEEASLNAAASQAPETSILSGGLSAAPMQAHDPSSMGMVPPHNFHSHLQPQPPLNYTNASAANSVSNPYSSATPAMGMYNYSATAFVGMPGSAGAASNVLGTGMMPPPPPGQAPGQQTPQAKGLPTGTAGLYGAPPPNSSSVTSGLTGSVGANAPGNNPSDSLGMPPTMQGMNPYGNPALYHYGQPPHHQAAFHHHMSQGVGYNYGYSAQFGGAVQGGFGYAGAAAMGQGGGYAPNPLYDQLDQSGMGGAGVAGSGVLGNAGGGGYQKSSGGYRGAMAGGGGAGGVRNNNNNNNMNSSNVNPSSAVSQMGSNANNTSSASGNNPYAAQYTPQPLGGYGTQPAAYGMGYLGDHHFSPRGAYGAGSGVGGASGGGAGMADPYGMGQPAPHQQQQQQQGSIGGGYAMGFPEDDPYSINNGGGPNSLKGKKGGRGMGVGGGGGGGLHQFQPQGGVPPHHYQQQQQHQGHQQQQQLHHPQQQEQQQPQQPFGLVGANNHQHPAHTMTDSSTGSSTSNQAAWSNPHHSTSGGSGWGGAGGWQGAK